MKMTEGEIIRDYAEAKDKNKQIGILADMNLATKKEMAQDVDGDTISRKGAIEAAEKVIERDTSGNNAVVNAMIAWSEYIKQLPSAQPERCADCDNFDKTQLLIPQPEKRTEERTETHGVCLDAISRQAAIDIFDDYNVSVENGELEAYSRDRKRLCDLPSVQPELSHTQKSCEYCHEDFDGYVRPIEKNSHAWLVRRGRTIKLCVRFKRGYSECDILFCPMCGRRLTDG